MLTLNMLEEILEEEEKRLEDSYGSSSFVTQNYIQGRIDMIDDLIEAIKDANP